MAEDSKDLPGNTEEDLKIFETLCISTPDKVFLNFKFVIVEFIFLNF